LILLVSLATGAEGISRIELFVSQELVHIAMELISPGFDNRIHYGTIAASEFSTIGVSLNLEFANRIHGRLNYISAFVQHVAEIRVIVNAIQQKVILQGTRPVGAEGKSLLGAGTRFRWRDSCTKLRQLRVIPTV